MRRRIALLLAGVVLAVLAVPAIAADDRDIVVVNRTGEPIYSLFISPVDNDDWEEDVLGVDVLPDGESLLVTFSGYAEQQCEFDILATNEDGDEWLLTAVDLCEVAEVVIAAKYIKAR